MNKLDIINAALRKVGARQVASADEQYPPLQAALSAFDFVIDEVLRDYAWSFATKYTTLAKLNIKPAFGYNNAFQLPVDCVVVLDLRGSGNLTAKEDNYCISENFIFTHAEQAFCRYISNAVPLNLWPVDFCHACAAKLAGEISLSAAQNPGLQNQLLQMYQFILDKAMLNDSRASNELELDPIASSKLLQARWN